MTINIEQGDKFASIQFKKDNQVVIWEDLTKEERQGIVSVLGQYSRLYELFNK
jgi:hypothetical protein